MDPDDVNHILALYSQRTCLELGVIDASSILPVEAVRSHARYLVTIAGKNLVITKCPSEPLLAIAAASVLETDGYYSKTLRRLIRELLLKDLLVEKGRKGEQCVRLLLIISVDLSIPR